MDGELTSRVLGAGFGQTGQQLVYQLLFSGYEWFGFGRVLRVGWAGVVCGGLDSALAVGQCGAEVLGEFGDCVSFASGCEHPGIRKRIADGVRHGSRSPVMLDRLFVVESQ